MPDAEIGDYFIRDIAERSDDDEPVGVPLIIPASPATPSYTPPVTAVPELRVPDAPETGDTASAPAPVSEVSAASVAGTRQAELRAALHSLISGSSDVEAAALVSLDGFTMVSALPADMQEDRVGAMSAAMLSLGERAAAELGRGHLSQVLVEADNGSVLLISAGDQAVLTVLASVEAKIGLVRYDARRTAKRIGDILR